MYESNPQPCHCISMKRFYIFPSLHCGGNTGVCRLALSQNRNSLSSGCLKPPSYICSRLNKPRLNSAQVFLSLHNTEQAEASKAPGQSVHFQAHADSVQRQVLQDLKSLDILCNLCLELCVDMKITEVHVVILKNWTT